MRKLLKIWLDRLNSAYEDREYKKMTLSLLGMLVFILAVGGAAVLIVYFLGTYIIILAIAAALIAFTVWHLKSDRNKTVYATDVIPPDKVTNYLNCTHQLLLEVFLDIFKLKADLLKLVIPLTVDDIRAKTPYITKGENGILTWAMHHFIAHKSEADRTYNLTAIRDTLHNALLLMIDGGRIENFPKFHKYDNILYVPIAIDSAIDSGVSLQVNVVVIKDGYIRLSPFGGLGAKMGRCKF